jgi:hypothetical protein
METKTTRLKRLSGGRTSRWVSPEKGQPTPVAHRCFEKAIGVDAVENQGKSTATSRLSCILEEEQTHGTKNQLRQASDPAKRNNNGLKTNCQAHYFHWNSIKIHTTMEVTALPPSFDLWKEKWVLGTLLL